MKLKDKVALVTGSARGIGREFALRFSREGARVVICDIVDCEETAREIESGGGQVLSLRTDVTSEESTVEMAKETFEHFGRIDVLVNNAAIYGGLVPKPFHQFTVEEWDRLMAVNLKGIFLCCKAVFPYMKEQGKGKIINIASTVALAGLPFLIHYVTSKGGVIAFTRGLAREMGEYNINVNAVAPGLIASQASLDMHPAERFDAAANTRQCIKRWIKPEDLTGTVAFLASEDSDMITGQVIPVDGGAITH